ncbi:MAG: glycine/sarcosine/betaine reductase component B subunit, partial [Actinomycetota bacterium]
GEPALAEATVEVVRPGDPVRVSNVLDVVLPDVLLDNAHLHRLDGVAVVTVCDWLGAGYPEATELPASLIDMAGPGSDRSPWGSTVNVVLRCVPAPGTSVTDADAAIRRGAADLARELARATSGHEPTAIANLGAPAFADSSLPGVVLIMQVASEGPLVETFWEGRPLGVFEPHVIRVRDVLTGSLANGAYDWPGVRNVTAVYQDNAMIRELSAADGTSVRFLGVILAPGYLDGAMQKRLAAEASASIAEHLGAAAAICTTFSSGDSHTDTMLAVQACERLGIRTVALVCETNGGLTDHVPEATSLISTGNEDELVEAWTPDRVIGGTRLALVGERVAAVHYVGGLVQTGDARWTAVLA